MTVGIYSLYWKNIDLVYIGQSSNIEVRYEEHKRKLRNKTHTNYKVQNMYNLYGIPEIQILEVCTHDSLNHKEILWTNEFDSLNKGLNIVEPGKAAFGTRSPSSKYSKFQILKVFAYLYNDNNYKSSYIANKCRVTEHLISDIFNSKSHTWLKQEYPSQYNKMLERPLRQLGKNNLAQRHEKLPKIRNTVSNEILQLTDNLREFCEKHNFKPAGISKLINGRLKTYHKYWVLSTE